jgi:hypothetical protein
MFNWSTHQLTEYFSAVNASADEASAIAGAVERAAEMVEAEVGAVVLNDRVLGAWGFGADVPVVAEGIENAAQLEALRTLRCGFGQGYHLCRPVDAGDVPLFLEQASRYHPNASLTA